MRTAVARMVHNPHLTRRERMRLAHFAHAHAKRAQVNWNVRRVHNKKSISVKKSARKIKSIFYVGRNRGASKLLAHVRGNRAHLRRHQFMQVGAGICFLRTIIEGCNRGAVGVLARAPTSRQKRRGICAAQHRWSNHVCRRVFNGYHRR